LAVDLNPDLNLVNPANHPNENREDDLDDPKNIK